MKRFTTLATLAVVGVYAMGATPPAIRITELTGLEKADVSPGVVSPRLFSSASEALGAPTAALHKLASAAPETGWVSIGEGTWIEDFFTPFGDVPAGSNWKVDVEKSGSWYRCLPYATGPVSENLNKFDTETYFYINATDPDKVYFETAWFWNRDFGVTDLVPENGWDGDTYDGYGTLKENVINFPTGSSAISFIEGQWNKSCPNEGTFLVLPEGDIPVVTDLSFSLSAPMCPDADGSFNIEVKCGKDIPNYVIGVVNNMPAMTENNLRYVAQHGTKLDRTRTEVTYTADPKDTTPGLKYVIAVAVDESNNVIQGLLDFFLVSFSDGAEWKDVGKVMFADPFVRGIYQMPAIAPYEVICQENVDRPGHYRLVNPYNDHPQFGLNVESGEYQVGHDHDHYIYLDASDPSYVKVEPSPIGVAVRYEDMYVGDMVSYYVALGNSLDKIAEAGYEPATFENGIMTFPSRTLYLGEKKYADGSPQSCGEATLDFSNVTSSLTVADDDATAPVEYFNLQGIKVVSPVSGLYIRRQRDSVRKVVLP